VAKGNPERAILPDQVAQYLGWKGYRGVRVTRLQPLGVETQLDLKAYGYGQPLRVLFSHDGGTDSLVLRTMAPDPFDHGRLSDRAAQMLLSASVFNRIPRHIRAIDVGVLADGGTLKSIPGGEFFLVTEYVEGTLYAEDLRRLSAVDHPREADLDRARALAHYLAELHAEPAEPDAYRRHLRDTVGSGEGLLGQCDAFAPGDAVATAARLLALQQRALELRARLAARSGRGCRSHGDFHPFNLLFRAGVDFSVLDCSRGGVGDPADDPVALSINYLFFAAAREGHASGALAELWLEFWRVILAACPEVADAVPLYFAWRTLVVINPVWYPSTPTPVRSAFLALAESLLAGRPFSPREVLQHLQ
jgi:aminoglycoside phosphotransferase (APT) family kinase protein